jgi:hypothetical protein
MFFQCVFTPVANGAVACVFPRGGKSSLLNAEYHSAGCSLRFLGLKLKHQSILTLLFFTFRTCCILNCLVCFVVSCLVCIVVVVLCVLLSSYVYLLYYVCIAVFTLDAGLLARNQYSEGPATGHLDTESFLGFPVSISKC